MITQRNVADILGPIGISIIMFVGLSLIPAWFALIGLVSLMLGIMLLLDDAGWR